jgi:hypothetical protein
MISSDRVPTVADRVPDTVNVSVSRVPSYRDTDTHTDTGPHTDCVPCPDDLHRRIRATSAAEAPLRAGGNWICQIAGKDWAEDTTLAGLVRSLIDVLPREEPVTDQQTHSPRRSPAESAPRIDQRDKPSAEELARQRAQLAARPRRPRTAGGWSA